LQDHAGIHSLPITRIDLKIEPGGSDRAQIHRGAKEIPTLVQ
jgi:hypothetical protein